MSEWLPYASLPPEMKDGRIVWLSAEDVGSYPMQWNPRGHNLLFRKTNKIGHWEMVGGGGLTWADDTPDEGPEFWREFTAKEAADLLAVTRA